MRVAAIDYRFGETNERKPESSEIRQGLQHGLQHGVQGQSLMTPARRAGLAALEREFSEYLKASQH